MRRSDAPLAFRHLPKPGTIIMALLIACTLLGGCQGALSNIQGQRIQYGDRILIKDGGQQTGEYRSEDLTVKYEYVRNGDSLKISGVIRFSNSVQGLFGTVRSFSLALVLADAQGLVLAQQGLAIASGQSVTEPLSFNKTIVVPPQTASMALGYNGVVSGTGTDGSPTALQHVPIGR